MASILLYAQMSMNFFISFDNIFSFSQVSSVCPGGHWLKSKSLKLTLNFGSSSLTFLSSLTAAFLLSEAVVLLNLLSN